MFLSVGLWQIVKNGGKVQPFFGFWGQDENLNRMG